MPALDLNSRRSFLAALAGAVAGAGLPGSPMGAAPARRIRLLLRSSWQTVNIGDIAHTPGVLHLLEAYLPEVEVRLWPSKVDHGVEEMLRRRFPKVSILKGPEDIHEAFTECDFLLHGSGPSLVGAVNLAKWRKTGKPYGIYGITLGALNEGDAEILTGARFAFFRDSVSLNFARGKGIDSPLMEFCPDGAFAVDLRNDAPAIAFLRAHGLEDGKFLCVIPRLRHTPYWTIPSKNTGIDARKQARNQAMKEHDHAPLRAAIIAVIRQTGMKVLVCPEDQTQMAVGQEMLVNPLPDDVKAKVVWHENYWLTDEAVSTYARSAGLFGNEMHSPIMCIGNGIPAIVCRWAEQTSKGFMWCDIGLGDWLFDLDDEKDLPRIAPAVLELATNPAAAKAKALKARAVVENRQRETMDILQRSLRV